MSLLKELAQRGILNEEKITSLENKIKESDKREEEVILREGIVPESVLFGIKSENLKIPLKEIASDQVLLKTLELIPEETAKYYQMIPVQKSEKFFGFLR